MTLPPMPALVGSRSGWRFAHAILLILLALQLIARPVWSQEAALFSATVEVDATADTVARARDLARVDGQRRALAVIAERHSGSGAPAKLPKLDDRAISALVASHEVANERMSAVRYLAEYTFHFKPAETRRVLGISGSAEIAPGTAEGVPKPTILIPVFQSGENALLWDDPNPWRNSWEDRPPASGEGRVVVPLGDAGDLAAIDAEKARAGDAGALAAVAGRNGGGDVVVALAMLRGPSDRPAGLDVRLRWYSGGRLVETRNAGFSANPDEGTDDLLRRAVAGIASEIEGRRGAQGATAADQNQEAALTAVLPITSLDDWLRARERLGAVPVIQKISVVSLSRQEATIEIRYSGTPDTLKSELAQIGLDLVHGGSRWRLARTGPGTGPGHAP